MICLDTVVNKNFSLKDLYDQSNASTLVCDTGKIKHICGNLWIFQTNDGIYSIIDETAVIGYNELEQLRIESEYVNGFELSEDEKQILDVMTYKPKHIDDICKFLDGQFQEYRHLLDC